MFLEIVTPEKKVFEGEVKSATFPGTLGSFQVLNNHAPLISTLQKGHVVYEDKDTEYDILIGGGVVEILNNRVILLADSLLEDEDEEY